jgi:hypothetical protein
MAIGKKLIDAIKNKKKKKTGTPKFAPGKGGGSDAARKGKGTVGNKKPAGPKTPSRKMFTPEQMKKLEKIHREAIKKGKKPKSNMPMLKRGGRAR